MPSTVTTTLTKLDASDKRVLTFAWTAATSGAVAPTAISDNYAKVLTGLSAVQAVTNPGSPAPTASYDITITDADGIDIFGSALVDRSATATEQARPAIATLAGKRLVDGVLTFNIANNSADSAAGVCKVYFEK